VQPLIGQVNRLEYFIDNDPGPGNGTAISITGGNDIQQNLTVPLTNVQTGYHTLFVRARDAQGRWSLTARHTFYTLPTAGNTIAAAEYFFDTDPGAGNGTTLPVTGGANITQNYTIPLSNLPYGFHTLFMRTRDNEDHWSLTMQKVFYLDQSSDTTRINAFNYQFERNGVVSTTYTYTLPTPAAAVDLNFTANLSGLEPEREYTMRIWAVTNTGQKSLVHKKQVKVCSGSVAKAGFDFITRGYQSSFIDSSTGTGKFLWKFGDGKTDSVSNPVHNYTALGVYNVQMIKSNFCNSDTLTKQVTVKGLTSISPNRGGNSGVVSVVINGAGFDKSSTVKLHGSQDIIPDTTIAVNNTTLQATFNLRNKPAGIYDVIVDFGNMTATLPKSFNVVPDTEGPKLSVDFVGRDAIRRGFAQEFEFVIRNNGLVDAQVVPVTLIIEGDSTMKVNMKADWIIPDNLGIDPGALSPIIRPDSLNGRPFDGIVMPVIIPQIKAGSEVVYICVLTTEKEKDLDIRVQANKPLASPDFDYMAYDCFVSSIQLVLEKMGQGYQGNCLSSWVQGALENDKIYMDPNRDIPQKMKAAVINLWTSVIPCAPDLKTPQRFYDFTKNFVEVLSHFETSLSQMEACGKFFYRDYYPLLKKRLRNVASFDPNEKTGLRGNTPQNHLQGNTPLGYAIYFENKNTATAPAQEVIILDTLDKTTLNASTFTLQSFGFGDSTWITPTGINSAYATTIILRRPGKSNLSVRIDAQLDTATGILKWRFLSLDPATREMLTDPLDGFLPPNVTSPEGQGFVSYTIQPKTALAHNTRIRNKAAIHFDNNPPIITNEFVNTVDILSPVSSVAALPATTPDTSFKITWSGTDADAGIRSYDVYYAINNGPYTLWLFNAPVTEAVFTGKKDSLYKFYSIAKDYAGNIENNKTQAEASILITGKVTGINDPQVDAFVVRTYPNPATNTAWVELSLSQPAPVRIVIRDLQGKEIRTITNRLFNTGTHKLELDMRNLSAGIYIVEFDGKKFRKSSKLVKQ
jgi:PKD repeat protein